MNTGKFVNLVCSIAEGDRPVTLQWLLNGMEITHDLGVNIVELNEGSSLLSIKYVSEKHAGNYSCIAKNLAGMDLYSSTLVVNGTKQIKVLMLDIYA